MSELGRIGKLGGSRPVSPTQRIDRRPRDEHEEQPKRKRERREPPPPVGDDAPHVDVLA